MHSSKSNCCRHLLWRCCLQCLRLLPPVLLLSPLLLLLPSCFASAATTRCAAAVRCATAGRRAAAAACCAVAACCAPLLLAMLLPLLRTRSMSRKPLSSTSSGLMSNSLATHTAAVLRTYGSSSCKQCYACQLLYACGCALLSLLCTLQEAGTSMLNLSCLLHVSTNLQQHKHAKHATRHVDSCLALPMPLQLLLDEQSLPLPLQQQLLPLALRQRCSGSHRYSVILSTRMQPMVRTARALISGLGSCESCKKEQNSTTVKCLLQRKCRCCTATVLR